MKYVLYEKYKLGRKVQDFLSNLYLGNGENILFDKKTQYRNKIIILYKYNNIDDTILGNYEYNLEGEVPYRDSCTTCLYYNKTSAIELCKFYNQPIKKIKRFCIDYYEQED